MSHRTAAPPRSGFLARGTWAETARVTELLRRETVGGALLLTTGR